MHMTEIFISALPWAQVVLSVLLSVLILIQRSEAGLGSAFGGDSGGSVSYTRRGTELLIFRTTIVLAILFVSVSLFILLV